MSFVCANGPATCLDGMVPWIWLRGPCAILLVRESSRDWGVIQAVRAEVLIAARPQGFYLLLFLSPSNGSIPQAVSLQAFYLRGLRGQMRNRCSTSCTSPRVLPVMTTRSSSVIRSTCCTSPRALFGCRNVGNMNARFYKLYFSKGSIWRDASTIPGAWFYKLYFSKGSI